MTYGGYEHRGGRVPAALATLFVAVLAFFVTLAGFATPARAQAADGEGLVEAGPIDPSNGYPYWYGDETGLRLELCLDPQDDKCLQPFEMPDPEAPVSFPENFPGEAFWWTGEAAATTNTGADALLVMALESAWGGDESVRDGAQISFGRVRVRVDDLALGSRYRVTHPYGVEEFVAEDDGNGAGEINFTEDLGCLTGPLAKCDFDEALAGDVGPFLTWDTFGGENDESALRGPNGEPNAYVGDPNVPHAVTGSPNDTNFFKVEELDASGNVVRTVAETDQFTVSGKVATPQVKPMAVGADRTATVFNDAQQKIQLVAADPESEVYYTTDGSDPSDPANPARVLYPSDPNDPARAIALNSDPAALEGVETTLRYVAIRGESSFDGSKTYEVDLLGPNLTVSEPAGTYDEASKDIAFTTNERARVYYTTDGSDPQNPDNPARRSFVYDPAAPGTDNVVHLGRTATIRAAAVDLDPAANDGEVNWGQPRSYAYTLAALKAAGPINPLGGYPFWYEDHNGLRLELCLDPNDQMCLQPFESPNPTGPVSFPENFPGEAFWWSGEADLALPGSDKAILVMAHEAAWGGADEAVRDGDQIVFGRIRVRIDGLQLGEQYRVSHPYGTDTYVAEDDGKGGGEINVTEDIGCGELGPVTRCDFDESRFGRVGPFLTWDTFGQSEAEGGPPAGYVGNPDVPHAVTGSPIDTDPDTPGVQGQNYFKLEHDNGGNWETLDETDQFSVSGKLSGLTAEPTVRGGTFNEPQTVELVASDPEARIIFTTDGTDPAISGGGQAAGNATDAPLASVSSPAITTLAAIQSLAGGDIVNGTEYTGPITLSESTELRYIVATETETSRVFSQRYTIDAEAPTVSASVESGSYGTAQSVELTSSEEGAKIYYATDGSAPTEGSTLYTDPIELDKTTTLKFFAVDGAGNRSEVVTRDYTINIDTAPPSAVTANPGPGRYDSPQRVTLRSEPGATIHYTTNGGTPTTSSTRFVSPIAVNRSMTIRAIAVDGSGNRSPVASYAYVIRKPSSVSLSLNTKTIKLRATKPISGRVSPAHNGSVKVTIKRNGKQVLARNLKLKNSRYSLRYKPNAVGRYSVSVRFAGDADHKPSTATKSFRVIRR